MRDPLRLAPSLILAALAWAAPPASGQPPPAPPAPAAPAAARVEVRVLLPGGAGVIEAKPVDPATPATPAATVVPADVPILHLTNGGFLTGKLLDAPNPAQVRWESPAFAGPLAFATSGIEAIRWPAPPQLPAPAGSLRFELAGGDILFGDLAALDDAAAEIDAGALGLIHVDRANVSRIVRRGGASAALYSGPNGLTGWTTRGPTDSWRDEGGHPFTDRPGAALLGDLNLPARAIVEFELSWKSRPDFLLALGVADARPAGQRPGFLNGLLNGRRRAVPIPGAGDEALDGLARAFRFEVFDGQLVISRESDAAADLAPLRVLPDGPGRVHLIAYLDQERGQIRVVSPGGAPLADLSVPDPGARTGKGITLVNVRGDVRLDRLQILPWDGPLPKEVEAGRSRILRADGSVSNDRVMRYDAPARAFVLSGDAGEARIDADQAADIFLGVPGEAAPPRPLHAVLADGTRLSGSLQKIGDGTLDLAIPGVREAIRVPLASVLSLALDNPATSPPKLREGVGVLELDGVRLYGHLADARAEGDATGLSWQADGVAERAPLRPQVSGRIVYKEPKPPTPPPSPQPRNRAQRVLGLNAVIGTVSRAEKSPLADRRMLHLRTGDAIPCEVTSIDEAGLHFTSAQCPGTFVPHALVKAVEMAPVVPNPIKLSKVKRERLLTLPRMQQDSPPTQLIRSTNGDYLRGRVLSLDATTLQVENHLETKPVPRERVARIIWLHADEAAPPNPRKDAPVRDESPRVQAVRADGIRLTFRPEAFAAGVLSGKSEALGECGVPLGDLDQLLIGAAIDRSATEAPYARWSLRPAEVPKFAQAGAAGGSEGMASPLVGKDAPAFELELLDGKPFRLADTRGQVVVLDFWATWCGPCLQAMPQVDRATRAFRDKGVKLVAVNLQETPKAITAMLERHKLDLTVALDRDGVVADRYGATAIPQTVLIGRDGKVARLYIGGGPDFETQLRDALLGLVEPGEAKDAPR